MLSRQFVLSTWSPINLRKKKIHNTHVTKIFIQINGVKNIRKKD